MQMLSIKEIVEISKKVHDCAIHDEKVDTKTARAVNTIANMAVELMMIKTFAEDCFSGKGTDYSIHIRFDEKRARKNMGLEEAEAPTQADKKSVS